MQYQFDWGVIYEYRALLLDGLLSTLLLSALALIISLAAGTLVALGRLYLPRGLSFIFSAFTELFRNIPPIVQFFFWYFAAELHAFPAAIVGLSVYTASHFAEIIRSGIASIPRTQIEAARSTGMSLIQIIRWVLLPQAFLRTVPPMASEVVNIVKNSSVAMTIGVTELSYQTAEIEAQTFKGFEAATAATLMYAAVGVCLLLAVHGLEKLIRRDIKVGI